MNNVQKLPYDRIDWVMNHDKCVSDDYLKISPNRHERRKLKFIQKKNGRIKVVRCIKSNG